MNKNFNGRPLKSAVINSFCFLPAQELMAIKNDLGLAMPIEFLIELQKKIQRPGGNITTDELYMMDAFADSLALFSKNYSFSEIRTDSKEIEEAFADVMAKRAALGFSMPVDHKAIADVYTKYLIGAGYDDISVRPNQDYRFFEKYSSFALEDSKYHASSSYFGSEECEILLAQSDRRYRFNTDKKKVHPLPNETTYHILLVRLDGSPLAFESLAEILHGNSHLSSDIAYCAPIGRIGLLSALTDTNHGYIINNDTVSALMGRAMNPFELATPMSCALLLVPSEVSQSIAMTILDFGYAVRFVGYTAGAKNVFSIFYQGIYHTLDANLIKAMLPGYSSCVTISSSPKAGFEKRVTLCDNISLSNFYGLSFDEAYTMAKEEIAKLSEAFPEERIYAYLAMPIITVPGRSNHNVTLPQLLGIYKALAENAIPLANYDFIPYSDPKNASLFLICDKK